MKHGAPAYVRYERPPVVEPLEALQLDSGERLEGVIKYYDYGVVSVVFQLPFSGGWDNLVHLASRWVWDIDFASRAEPLVRARLDQCADAMIRPARAVVERRLLHLSCERGAGRATGCGPDSGSRAGDCTGGSRRPDAAVRGRVQ